MLTDDNDSVKIMAVHSTLAVVSRMGGYGQLVREEIVPPLKVAVENKMATWRLRFSVAEVAAKMCEYLPDEVINGEIMQMYENLITDKEPEVKSEAITKLPDLAKYASAGRLTEKILP